MPVSSEIWAFHCSVGSWARNSRLQWSPSIDTSCSGSGSDTPPRAASRASRSSPTSLSSISGSSADAVVDRPLDAGVVELGRGPHPGPLDRDVGALAGRVDLDRPQQRRADLVGQQRRGALGDQRWVQRHLRVGAVEGLAALVGLHVDRVARGDERREVGDRVVDDVAVAVAHDVHRLVEVHRGGRVDGHQRQVGAVEVGQPRCGDRGLRRGDHLGGELRGDLELLLDPRDALAELVRGDTVVGARDVDDATGGHALHPSQASSRESGSARPCAGHTARHGTFGRH